MDTKIDVWTIFKCCPNWESKLIRLRKFMVITKSIFKYYSNWESNIILIETLDAHSNITIFLKYKSLILS